MKSLPYATWVTIPEEQAKQEGVTVYDKRGAAAGLNLFAARAKAEAYLMDMAGNMLHTWQLDARKFHGEWHHVELCKNGDLLVVVRNRALVRVDWDSRVKWKIGQYHYLSSVFHHHNDISLVVFRHSDNRQYK